MNQFSNKNLENLVIGIWSFIGIWDLKIFVLLLSQMQIKKILAIPALILGLVIMVHLSRSIIDIYGGRGRVFGLREEITTLEKEKTELEGEKSFRQTVGFVEREARDELRMVREGEKILVLPKKQNEKSSKFKVQSSKNGEEAEANWKKWVDYWFGM